MCSDRVESTPEEVREFRRDMAKIGIRVSFECKFLTDFLREVRSLGITAKAAAEGFRRANEALSGYRVLLRTKVDLKERPKC